MKIILKMGMLLNQMKPHCTSDPCCFDEQVHYTYYKIRFLHIIFFLPD